MEIENLKLLENLEQDSQTLSFVDEYFKINNGVQDILRRYNDIFYLDEFSKFYFLYSHSERFFNVNEDYLKAKETHVASVFQLLFSEGCFPQSKNFKYSVKSTEELTLYIWISFQAELFRLAHMIIKNTDLQKYLHHENIQTPALINNNNHLFFAPFIFPPLDLSRYLDQEFQELKFEQDNLIIRENEIINLLDSRLSNVKSQIFERTGLSYIKNYNYSYYNSVSSNYNLSDAISLLTVESKKVDIFEERNIYLIDSSFSFVTDEFLSLFFKKTYTEEFSILNANSYYSGTIDPNEIAINELKQKTNEAILIKELKDTLKFYCTGIEATKIIHKFIDLDGLQGDERRQKEWKGNFSNLITFLTTNKSVEIPIITEIEYKEIVKLFGFFDYLASMKLVSYKINDLKKLLSIISKNESLVNNSTLNKAHLRKGKLDENLKRTLKDFIPYRFLQD